MGMTALLFVTMLMFVQAFSSQTQLFKPYKEENVQSLVAKACQFIDAHDSCVSNIRTHIQESGHGLTPHSVLTAAVKEAHDKAKLAMQGIPTVTTLSFRSREQIAIEDCKELVGFSVSELAWSMLEMNKLHGGGGIDGDSHDAASAGGNLKTWLSAAMSNQDTCLEGFEGTERKYEEMIKGSLRQVTQLVSNVLDMYTQLNALPFKPSRNESSVLSPEWLSETDESLMTRVSPSAMHPKKGLYRENIDMKKKKTNIMLVGDGIGQTIITGDRNFLQGLTTFRTATVAVSGRRFIARDITFRNTAGPHNRQAVALRVDSDQSAFFRCSMEGYQDTLYAHSLRQFYRECEIYGTIDFIFGNGAAVLQNCKIYTRDPLPLQKVTITAQGRKSPNQNTGFVIMNSYVLATQPTYLGRPWKLYSRTVYMNTYMSQLVQPRGWLEWFGNFALDTLWYGEYNNIGPGWRASGRVKWPGYHIMDKRTAMSFTVGSFIDGRRWLPATGVTFTAGLAN
ncbi:hypothetical protein DY000_02051384 [Brassica cretica]|uniref:Pectinesterase n=1 Tax=Brassica cretica TaxID=69181 RepID=A0ABQ7EX34_BRACR|nr:hypothetical protein DY000_02051384 [Brassica cretica]